MRRSASGLLVVAALLAAALARAEPYGDYDPKKLLVTAQAPAAQKYSLDLKYLDTMLADLARHAENYPVQFDTPQDRQRAVQDVRKLSGMFDIVFQTDAANPALLLRAGFLNSVGHNLDIPGAAAKADSSFRKLLAIAPADARGNYLYGKFLAGAGKPDAALPYLEKARTAGLIDAEYAIGMVYLTLGDSGKALARLENYKHLRPADRNVDTVMDAIRNGKFKVEKK